MHNLCNRIVLLCTLLQPRTAVRLAPPPEMITFEIKVYSLNAKFSMALKKADYGAEKRYGLDTLQEIDELSLFHLNDSDATTKALQRHIPTYDKSRKFLEKEKWVKSMVADGKMETACRLAERYDDKDSYSVIYRAIGKLESR